MDELSLEECHQILDGAAVAHIAVIADDEPYVTPISFVRIEDRLLLRTATGRRLDAVRENPRVCIEVSEVDEATGDWRSVIVWGRASVVDDPTVEVDTVTRMLEKYRLYEGPVTAWSQPELFPGTAVVVVVPIERISGRTSGSGLQPKTRPGRL